MQSKNLFAGALLALMALSATSQAALSPLGGLGNVYLGFDNNGAGGAGNYKNVVIDLGSVSQLLSQGNFNNPLIIDQSGGGSVLNTVFGPSWQTNSNISWWAFAGTTSSNSLYLATPVGGDVLSDGTISGGAVTGVSSLTKNAINTSMSAMTTEMNNTNRYTLGTLTGTGIGGSFTFVSSTDKNYSSSSVFQNSSWGELVDAANGTTGASIVNNLGNGMGRSFTDGTDYTGLGLYNYTNSGGNYVANFAAPIYFNVTSSGTITVVPEPSTNALLAIGRFGLIFFVARNMRRTAKTARA